MKDIHKALILNCFVDALLLIGECKWTGAEDAQRLYNRLQSIAAALPFAKCKQVHIALFTKSVPLHSENKTVFLPSQILQ